MERQFDIECPICDIETTVVVKYEDEVPSRCPMCGEDVDAEQIEDQLPRVYIKFYPLMCTRNDLDL